MKSITENRRIIEMVTPNKEQAIKLWNRLSELKQDKTLRYTISREWIEKEMEKAMELIVLWGNIIDKAESEIDEQTESLLKKIFKEDYIPKHLR